MARNRQKTVNWPVIAGGGTVFVLMLAGVAAWFLIQPEEEAAELSVAECLPTSVVSLRANTEVATRDPGDLAIYLDASGGMRGYAVESDTGNVIGNLRTLANNFTRGVLYQGGDSGNVTYYRFGEYVFNEAEPAAPPVIEDSQVYADPAADPPVYTDQNTNIADLIQWIEHDRMEQGNRALALVVTDFMLDEDQPLDEFAASVGGPLRNMVVQQDLALGIYAVRTQFKGRVYAQSPAGLEADLEDRPIVILMIGSPYQVREFYDYLVESEVGVFSGGAAVSDQAFSLFGLEAGSIMLSEPRRTAPTTGFNAIPPVRDVPGLREIEAFSYTPDNAVTGQPGEGLRFRLEANAGVKDFEVIGNEPGYLARAWRLNRSELSDETCGNGGAWTPVNIPANGWQRQGESGQSGTYTLSVEAMQAARMDEPGLYLVEMVAGQAGLVENHPAAAWLGEWSMTNAEIEARLAPGSRATRIGIPGLDRLRNVLLRDLRKPGNDSIVRSASYAIIETR